MFDTSSQLFWYRLVFLAELFISEAMFTAHLSKRKYFVIRVICSVLAISGISMLIPIAYYNAWFISVMFLFMFVLTVIGIKFCFSESWWNVIFCGLAAYSVQHMSYIIYNSLVKVLYLDQIVDSLVANNPYSSNYYQVGSYSIVTAIAYFQIYFSVYWISYYVFARKIKSNEDLHIKNFSLVIVSGIVILTDVFLNMVTVFNSNKDTLSGYLEDCYNAVSCLLALFLQFSALERKKAENELESYKNIWNQRTKQYEMSKENINLINLKCHNLKYQIHNLGLRQNIDSRELNSIEKAISIYDSTVKTGNTALDTILTEKALVCENNGIVLNMMIDPNAIDFMDSTDIYTLFGNAMDNAIEYLLKQEKDKRNITIIVKKKGNMISIHFENYYQGEMLFKDDLPATTKDDKGFHGFGVKSIKAIVEKYHGVLTFEVKQKTFNMSILYTQIA